MKTQTKKAFALFTIVFFALSFLAISTVKADDTNLRPMSSFYAGMVSKDATYGADYAVIDNSVLDPNNQPTMRVTTNAYPGTGDGAPGEVDSTWSVDLTGLGGHTIYAGVWIKTGPYSGDWNTPTATLNLDLLVTDPVYGFGIATSNVDSGYGGYYQLISTIYPNTEVPPSSGWVFAMYNFTVPTADVPYITTTYPAIGGSWGVFACTAGTKVTACELSFWTPVVGMSTWYGSPFLYIDPSFVPSPSTTPAPTASPTPSLFPTASPTPTAIPNMIGRAHV